jgi:hypothetical protein
MKLKLGDTFDPENISLQEAIEALSLKRADAKRCGYGFYYRGKPCKNGHINFYAINYGCIECHVQRFNDAQPETEKRLAALIDRIKIQVFFVNKDLHELFDDEALKYPSTAEDCRRQGQTRFFPRYPCQHGHISLCVINRETSKQCLMCLDALKQKYPARFVRYSRKHEQAHKEKRRLSRNKQRKTLSARKRINSQRRARYASDLDYRIQAALRARVTKFLTGENKSASTTELIGCDIQTLRAHLECQFTDGMSWENYGDWHIDHIQAISFFDLTDPEQQKLCFNYRNLQPLWAFDNLSKGGSNRVDKA